MAIRINSIETSYKMYKSSVEKPVNKATYKNINYEFNRFLMEKVKEGHTISLPEKIGKVSVLGKKQKLRFEEGKIKGLAPDWVKTKKLWESNPIAKEKKQLLYHENNHTDGVRYKYIWWKKGIILHNKALYSLRVTRENKRTISSVIVNGANFKTL